MSREKVRRLANSLDVQIEDDGDSLVLETPEGFVFEGHHSSRVRVHYNHGNKPTAWTTLASVLEGGLEPDLWRGHFTGE